MSSETENNKHESPLLNLWTKTFYLALFCIFSLCNIGFLGHENAFAQGSKAGSFLRVGLGAQAKAMGGAYTAMAKGVEASYYNPAGLPLIQGQQVLASYRALSLDRQFTFIGFASSIQPKISSNGDQALKGGIALTWLRAGVSDIDGRNTDGQHFDNLATSENAFTFAFALNPVKRLSLGLAVKVLWNRFPDLGLEGQTIDAKGVGFDFGVLYTFNDWLSLAATAKEINAKYRWNTGDLYDEKGSETIDELPKIARYGVAIRIPRHENITVALDYEQLFKEKIFRSRIDQRLHVGAQGVFRQDIVVRAGYDDGAITAGAGYRFPVFGKQGELNYAFSSAGDRPEEEHIFTWVFHF